MLIGVIADDFTGASDIANTLAKGLGIQGGLVTAQYNGVPNMPAQKEVEAGVIALKSRTIPRDEAIASSLRALEWLKSQGCRQIVFKYCSTFDSTEEGNIGPVAEALAIALGTKGVVVCPAFPTAGRTIYKGHLFVFDKLLNESGMQNHPLTPMKDADVRRWLGHQCEHMVGHVDLSVVSAGSDAISAALHEAGSDGALLCVVDAITDDNLLLIAKATANAPLVTGGSGIALGLPQNFILNGEAKGSVPLPEAVSGDGAILAGSCSGATLSQIQSHSRFHPAMAIDVAGVMEQRVTPDSVVSFFEENRGFVPIAYSSGDSASVKALQEQFGRDAIAFKLDAFFSQVACGLIDIDFRRLVVAGGETSGAVATAIANKLSVSAMRIGPEIDPGVPVLTLNNSMGTVALALKSGNFGSTEFFVKAVSLMGGNND